MSDIAVIIPCSKRKVACPLPPATAGELALARLGAHDRLADHACAARELYRGRQHRSMIAAIDSLRVARPELLIAVHIVSAGYGVLSEHDQVVPYDAALGSRSFEWRATGRRLGLRDALCAVVDTAQYALICLSTAYLIAADAPFTGSGNQIYIAAGSGPLERDVALIPAGRIEARQLGVPEREVRGVVLGAVCQAVARGGPSALSRIASSPREGGRAT